MKLNEKTHRLTLCGMFVAIIIVMTVIPFTGYISYSPIGVAITTLHIPVIIGSMFLGPKYGALLGGVWGVTCLVKAFLNPDPANIPFQNPLVSVLPRIIVGLVAAAVFALCCRWKKLARPLAALISAVVATLTNTVLVLTMLYVFNAYDSLAETAAAVIETIIMTIVSLNGALELGAAAVIVPLIYTAVARSRGMRGGAGS